MHTQQTDLSIIVDIHLLFPTLIQLDDEVIEQTGQLILINNSGNLTALTNQI